ncbi:hypothetical protein [Verrucomicrobium sp. BvORR106]|uniref:hypothetical protein n=1 Tax=Verrucomicrobium sp. BvORR106 TaxID=1403819 RepID=UPI002240F10D|nr:hypothetical protein [Verrucomicrobium sp. BvORR106]
MRITAFGSPVLWERRLSRSGAGDWARWALLGREGFKLVTRGAKAAMLAAVPKALRAQVLDVNLAD